MNEDSHHFKIDLSGLKWVHRADKFYGLDSFEPFYINKNKDHWNKDQWMKSTVQSKTQYLQRSAAKLLSIEFYTDLYA